MEYKLGMKGFTALTEMTYGLDLTWSITESSGVWPDIYNSPRAVWEEIADDAIEQLTQFIDRDREFDDVDWNIAEQYQVVEIQIDEKGMIRCWNEGKLLYIKDINEWRTQL